jgi:hypothetical protein
VSDQQLRLSGRKRGCRPPRAVRRWRFIESSERTEPIAADQSARPYGNPHRTVIAAPIAATGLLPDSLLPANWPRNCEYGPIFDPLQTDLSERLRSATPRFAWTSHATSLHEVLNEEADCAFAGCVATLLSIRIPTAQAKQKCSAAMLSNPHGYWCWRLIDGRKMKASSCFRNHCWSGLRRRVQHNLIPRENLQAFCQRSVAIQ